MENGARMSSRTVRPRLSKNVGLLARMIPLDVLQTHAGMCMTDLIAWVMATNLDRRFILVEAFAGTGKTRVLVNLVRRLPDTRCVLMLSFTRSATEIARGRLQRLGVRIQSQTFDSFFYHATRTCLPACMHAQQDEMDFEAYRKLSRHLTCEILTPFRCKARARYSMDDIEIVLVDEAQDTPPDALYILETFRRMGKSVLCVGDRLQVGKSPLSTQSLNWPTDVCLFSRVMCTRGCGAGRPAAGHFWVPWRGLSL
jgi:hypothetical protein